MACTAVYAHGLLEYPYIWRGDRAARGHNMTAVKSIEAMLGTSQLRAYSLWQQFQQLRCCLTQVLK